MNGARDERRDCKGQVDHLSPILEDMGTNTFVFGVGDADCYLDCQLLIIDSRVFRQELSS